MLGMVLGACARGSVISFSPHPCAGGKSSLGLTVEETKACRDDLPKDAWAVSGAAEIWKLVRVVRSPLSPDPTFLGPFLFQGQLDW